MQTIESANTDRYTPRHRHDRWYVIWGCVLGVLAIAAYYLPGVIVRTSIAQARALCSNVLVYGMATGSCNNISNYTLAIGLCFVIGAVLVIRGIYLLRKVV